MIKKKALLIAEKPSFMRDIQKAYNHIAGRLPYEITFVAQVGHLVELLDPVELNPIYKSWDVDLLPIDPDKEDGWKYKVKRSVRDVYKNIEKEVKSGKYDVIIHAGDADQEGELLIRLVLNKIGNTLPVLRFWANKTTQQGLEEAFDNLKDDNSEWFNNLYQSGLLRQQTDWLFGMNGSRAIASRIYAGRDNKIAAGRVMTWIQTAIVDREDEIKNFIPKTTYGVKVTYTNTMEGNLYEIPENVSDDEKSSENVGTIYFENIKDAENLINSLGNAGTVKKINKIKTTTYAPSLYKLAKLQEDGSKLGFSADRTLEIVQQLYEKHLLSYPRTDCEVLSSTEDFRAIISSAAAVPGLNSAATFASGRISEVISNSKYVNDKELAKHGHSALVPTDETPDFSTLDPDEQAIYTLVAKRFLAIFQPPLIQNKVTILTDIDGHIFRTTGKTVVDPGYTTFTGEKIADKTLPIVNEGETLLIASKNTVEKTTTCPKRFTDGTLIAAMENPSKYLADKTIKESVKDLSIGTSATRGAIIKKVIDDKYVERKKGYLYPTDFGSFMIHTIRGISLCKIDITGQWEQILMKVRQGEITSEVANAYLKGQLNELIHDIKNINKVTYGNSTIERKEIMKCPCCGKPLMMGPVNYYCSGYRDGCKCSLNKKFLEAQFTEEDAIALFSGKIIEKTLAKHGDGGKIKSWKQKLKYNFSEGKLDFVTAPEELTKFTCPNCKENLYKQGKKIFCKSCNFKAGTEIASRQLEDEEINEILTQGITQKKLSNFYSPNKNKYFSARVGLKKENNQAISFEFKFNF